MHMSNNTMLITGGGTGIGRALALLGHARRPQQREATGVVRVEGHRDGRGRDEGGQRRPDESDGQPAPGWRLRTGSR